MSSLLVSTWTVISNSASLLGSARQMSSRVSELLAPANSNLLRSLSDQDRRKLLALQSHVETLVQPLQLLLTECFLTTNSCVQQILANSQQILLECCQFTESLQDIRKDSGSSQRLDFLLSELNFVASSLHLATSLISRSRPECRVSLSALIRSSRRVQEMHRKTGDLLISSGSLYWSKEECENFTIGIRQARLRIQHVDVDAKYVYFLTLETTEASSDDDPELDSKLEFNVEHVQETRLRIEESAYLQFSAKLIRPDDRYTSKLEWIVDEAQDEIYHFRFYFSPSTTVNLETSLSPPEIITSLRLCILETRARDLTRGSFAAHLYSADEVLEAVLRDF